MGCHTWYKKPLVKGKEDVQKYLREKIDTNRKKDWWNDEYNLMLLTYKVFLNSSGYISDAMNRGVKLSATDR
jgi:hypothetical protein